MSSIDTPAGSSSSSEPSAERLARVPSTGAIVACLVLVALVLRLWELGARPMHHDESLDAWWSWLFRNGNYERYDPVYHGPLRFYITAGLYEIFGESAAVARLFSAVTGTAVVGLPWFLRRELGRVGTIAAATALTVSPTMLYYSRFGREDAQMVFLTLLSLVLGLAYLRRPRTGVAASLAFVLACSFAIKESTYLFAMLLAIYLLVVLAAQFDSQTRRGAERVSGDLALDRTFFGAALLFATLGLLITVVIGAASDELFAMLGLYVGGLVAFVLAAAMPRLRAAGIEWSMARASLALVGIAVAGQVIFAYREPAGSWSSSIVVLGAGVSLVVLAAAMTTLNTFRQLDEARTWSTAFALAAVGLLGHEWLERHIAQLPTDERWQVSLPAITLGTMAVAVAALIRFGSLVASELPSAFTTARAQSIAGPVALAGVAVILNEYTESEADRVAAVIAICFVVGGIHLAAGALPTTTNSSFTWPPLLRAFGAIGWRGWLISAGVFAASWYVFFTVFGTVKEDWASGFTRAIDYWDSQQEVNRGGQPWYYYLYALPAYEWFFVILAAIGGWSALRRPTVMSGLFVWFSIGGLIIYSYAGERMPWLIAHPLLPMLILAGLGAERLWKLRGHRAMPTVATFCVVALLATMSMSWRASFPHGADSREILTQAGQATPHVTAALERLDNIDRISRQTTGEPATLAIGTANAWPYNWYLRDRANVLWFTNEDGPPADPTIDVIIADHGQIETADYPEFQATLFAMRSWWVPTYTDAGVGGWLAWARSLDLWEQRPNPAFAGVKDEQPSLGGGLGDRLDRLQSGADGASRSFITFTGADHSLRGDTGPALEVDDGRDGCGSVDQWFLVRNEFAAAEQQVYPGSIAKMGPLDCASDRLSTS